MIRLRSLAFSAITAGGALGLAVGLTGVVFGHGKEHNPTRYQYVVAEGVPSQYAGLLNPLRATPDSLATGEALYEQNCLFCHGDNGEGDGELASDLEPAPAAITGMYDSSMIGMGKNVAGSHLMHGVLHHHPGQTHAQAMGGVNLDAYMFWAVSEGGEPMGSAMPAFKDILSEEERWQILLYVANNFSTEPR